MTPIRFLLSAAALSSLVACATDTAGPADGEVARLSQVTPGAAPGATTGAAFADAPADAAPGSCWGKIVTPAVIETVTEQVQVVPAKMNPDGTIATPPVYRTETRQEFVRDRQPDWFETPCPDLQTPEFVASVQRALQARNLFVGPITGTYDARTRAAVQRFQALQGLDSGDLSLASARQLGLIAVPAEG